MRTSAWLFLLASIPLTFACGTGSAGETAARRALWDEPHRLPCADPCDPPTDEQPVSAASLTLKYAAEFGRALRAILDELADRRLEIRNENAFDVLWEGWTFPGDVRAGVQLVSRDGLCWIRVDFHLPGDGRQEEASKLASGFHDSLGKRIGVKGRT